MPIEPDKYTALGHDPKLKLIIHGETITAPPTGSAGYLPHWPNCPKRDDHRKAQKRGRR